MPDCTLSWARESTLAPTPVTLTVPQSEDFCSNCLFCCQGGALCALVASLWFSGIMCLRSARYRTQCVSLAVKNVIMRYIKQEKRARPDPFKPQSRITEVELSKCSYSNMCEVGALELIIALMQRDADLGDSALIQ